MEAQHVTTTATATRFASHRDQTQSRSRSDSHGDFSPTQRPKKSSSTCSVCRLRKVRCNGSRPVCSNCHRLGFPCSYDDSDADSWSMALPRRRVKQACLSCHSRKARCSGHMPVCDRCRAQGIDCVYRPGKRVKGPTGSGNRRRPQSPCSHDGDDGYRQKDTNYRDGADDTDTPLTDLANTPSTFNHDM